MSAYGFGKSGYRAQELKPYSTSATMHQEVMRLVTNGTRVDGGVLNETAATDGWRATVMLDLVYSWNPFGGSLFSPKYYPGHAGLAIWRAAPVHPRYVSTGIYSDGSLGEEGVNADDTYNAGSMNLWYFTKPISRTSAIQMLQRINAQGGKTLTYSEFLANRYTSDSYNCHTYVDDVLAAGGLSSVMGRPSSWLTPWFYSLSFSVSGWHSSVMYNTKNIE